MYVNEPSGLDAQENHARASRNGDAGIQRRGLGGRILHRARPSRNWHHTTATRIGYRVWFGRSRQTKAVWRRVGPRSPRRSNICSVPATYFLGCGRIIPTKVKMAIPESTLSNWSHHRSGTASAQANVAIRNALSELRVADGSSLRGVSAGLLPQRHQSQPGQRC